METAPPRRWADSNDRTTGVDLLKAKPEWRRPVAIVFGLALGFVVWNIFKASMRARH